jgi:hypothetical protein
VAEEHKHVLQGSALADIHKCPPYVLCFADVYTLRTSVFEPRNIKKSRNKCLFSVVGLGMLGDS